jgi:deoxyribodipyrimidine photo-lyase
MSEKKVKNEKYKKSIFIFHRDLRTEDNIGLINCLEKSEKVIPIFIFTPSQIGKENKYKSNNAVQFMIETLKELNKNVKIYFFYGETNKVLKNIIKNNKIDAVFSNLDYSPYALFRDKNISQLCDELNINCYFYEDVRLTPIDKIKNKSNTPFKKFTPFMHAAKKLKVSKPMKNEYQNYYKKSLESKYLIDEKELDNYYKENKEIWVNGGRTNAEKILNNLKNFKNYAETRNYPEYETTNLSAYLKFGVLSIREVYHKVVEKFGHEHLLLTQFYWRDFYMYLLYHFPYTIDKPFQEKFDKLNWEYDEKKFELWKSGNTGFPFVDAGMRQLNKTGFMHNRVRMIVASFLTKDLHLHWKLGEQYFSNKLVDADVSNNCGNWQWSSSIGADAQPYFRIFKVKNMIKNVNI